MKKIKILFYFTALFVCILNFSLIHLAENSFGPTCIIYFVGAFVVFIISLLLGPGIGLSSLIGIITSLLV